MSVADKLKEKIVRILDKTSKLEGIEYIADFKYIENGKIIVEDVKGIQTDVFKLKHKLFEKKYPDLELKIIK